MNTSARPRASVMKKDRHAALFGQSRLSVHRPSVAASASTPRPLRLQGDRAADFRYDVPAAAVQGARSTRNKLTRARHQYAARRREGEFGLAAVPGREQDWQVLRSRKALDYVTPIGGSAMHCLAGKVSAGAAAGGRARVHRAILKRAADLAADKNIKLLDRADQSARPAELFSQSRRARRRHHRQGRQAERAACSSISITCRSSAAT